MSDLARIFQGKVMHHRRSVKDNRFEYRYFCIWLNLDDLETDTNETNIFCNKRFSWAKFRRGDYMGDSRSGLADYVRNLCGLKEKDNNYVWFLGQLSYLGSYFSPVNFYFVGPKNQWHTMVAEVSNTPWGEKHHYVVPLESGETRAYSHQKTFHVSPFMPLNQQYFWNVAVSDEQAKIDITLKQDGDLVFDAKLALGAQELNQTSLRRVITNNVGWMLSTRILIYWQALKLWFKGVSYQSYPGATGNETQK